MRSLTEDCLFGVRILRTLLFAIAFTDPSSSGAQVSGAVQTSGTGVRSGRSDSRVLHIVIVEMHDRLTPTPKFDIVKQHVYEVELHTDKHITETVSNSDVSSGVGRQDPGGSREMTLGQDVGVFWHVKGANSLQRTQESGGLVSVWSVTVSQNRSCHVQVRMSIRPGLSVYTGTIAGTQTDATFNNYRVRHVECSVN
jgi:hypothetical protein